MKLSICLITYNRARYLRKTLTTFFAIANFPFDYELLVCDNCSTDETPAVVAGMMRDHPQLRYVRQKTNVGSEANQLAAFHMAQGEYLVYLADDDQLVPEAVAQVLSYMDRHQDVAVCHCPWELWDDVSGQSRGLFYKVDAPIQFGCQDSLALCDFILNNHIFPEISIYRAEVAQRIIYMPRAAYSAFVHLMNTLDLGKVAFLPIPYYRSITQHWPGEHREQAGYGQAISDWDNYRGGLELMIHRACLLQGKPGVADEHADAVGRAVQQFVNKRLQVALRLLMAKHDYIAAHAVMLRLLVARAMTPNEAEQIGRMLNLRAGLQAFIQIFDATTVLEQIGLYETSNPAALQALLQEFRPDLPIVHLDERSVGEADQGRTLILTARDESRAALVNAGYHPGFVAVERDLVALFAT